MRRLKAAIAVVIALALLAGAALLVERWARSEAENRIEAAVAEQVPGMSDDLEATVGGTLITPQLLGGTFEEVRVTSSQATLEGFTVTDVVVVAQDVPIRGGGSISRVTATATAPTASVLAAIRDRVDLPDGVTIELFDGEIAVVTSIFTVPLQAFVTPVAGPRSISFEVSRFSLGGVEVSASAIPLDLNGLLASAAVDLDMLPAGFSLTSLTVTPDGIDLVVDGADIAL